MSVPDAKRTPSRPPSGWGGPPGYEITELLGRGSTGAVYRARDHHLPRWVALKMLGEGADSDGRALARFRSEAEAMARLNHPHIVQIHALGEHDGLPFIVMEHVPGESLARKLRAGASLTPGGAAHLIQVLAWAVHEAHRTGLIHRDLKPDNILLAPPVAGSEGNTALGFPKIADFGLVSPVIPDPVLTETGAIQGTPTYMAPEQAAGQPEWVCPATDVYALGVILYELLTGRVPFDSDNVLQLLRRVREEEPVPPGVLRAGIPPCLEAVCLRCLNKTPAFRYATALDLADALAPFATSPERAGENGAQAGPSVSRETGRFGMGAGPWPRRRTWRREEQPTWNFSPPAKGTKATCVGQPA
jgi:serine/threonine protein kinase